MRVAIAGAGAIGLASAAWLAHAGHAVALWSPRSALPEGPVHCTGLLDAALPVEHAATPAALVREADVVIVAAPLPAHRALMDALLPHLQSGQTVLVSAMGSLSALYLFERLRAAGRAVTVVSLSTTALTARRGGPGRVQIMTRRAHLGLSALPRAREGEALALCGALFGPVFSVQGNALSTALSNTNPIAHVPLVVANWTRLERAEAWPQYHYMTPRVSDVIERLDAERQAVASAFGLQVHGIVQHFAQSFGTRAPTLAGIAAELHAARGGPPGPTSIATRYLSEDVPFGLVFQAALGRVAGVATPATQTTVEMATLLAGTEAIGTNDLLEPLGLADTTAAALRARADA